MSQYWVLYAFYFLSRVWAPSWRSGPDSLPDRQPLLIVAYLLIEWIRVPRWAALLEIGMLWVALTFFFEMVIGYMRGRSWQSLLSDYDIAHGGLMALALVLVLFAPLIAAWLRSSKSPQPKAERPRRPSISDGTQ